MQYRILGKTGLRVSVIGFGGIPIQRISQEEASKVIVRAEELGINFIDTARGYTISENYIGEALQGRRDKWIIASKSMARDRESMARDIETTLKNLKTDYIDLYQFHNIRSQEDYDRVFGKGGAYEALIEAREQGKIRHIGVTSHSVDAMKLVMENADVETIMCPYNIVETQAGEMFTRAAELGKGIIAMKPLAGGAIQNGALAMKFILENQDVTMAIPGMAGIGEVEQNASVGIDKFEITSEEREEILRISKELSSEFCRRCGYCAPCPQGIDIPSMFLFHGYKKRYNLTEWAEGRYFTLQKRAKDCAGCGECEGRCPYGLPIRKMLYDVKEDFNDF